MAIYDQQLGWRCSQNLAEGDQITYLAFFPRPILVAAYLVLILNVTDVVELVAAILM